MKHFPIFLNLDERRVLVSGAGAIEFPKLRLLSKTPAIIEVYGESAAPQVRSCASEGALVLHTRSLRRRDAEGATLCYCANGDASEDARAAAVAKSAGALVNIVDNLQDSEFITPAIVDRDPVTVAIGTEGTAPVLARRIKSEFEAALPTSLGLLARIGADFRARAASLKPGRQRREFWSRFFRRAGPAAVAKGGEAAARATLLDLLEDCRGGRGCPGMVHLVGAGPGDAELLTLKARRALDAADAVLHDISIPGGILELARREAEIIPVCEKGAGPGLDRSAAAVAAAQRALAGEIVVMLKAGDASALEDLGRDVAELEEAGAEWEVVPGVATRTAAAGPALAWHDCNSGMTHYSEGQTDSFPMQGWREIAQSGRAAAIPVNPGAVRLAQSRRFMRGAADSKPVALVENAACRSGKAVETSVIDLASAAERERTEGPMPVLPGLPPGEFAADAERPRAGRAV